MLQKPDLDEKEIIKTIAANYGIHIVGLEFLPIGADLNSSAFRGTSAKKTQYFIKLRSGVFEDVAVTLPKYLAGRGILQVIPPQETIPGKLWVEHGPFKMILYPYIYGKNGYETGLTKHHWEEFGSAVRNIHWINLPKTLQTRIPGETYSPKWRDRMRGYMAVSPAQEPAHVLAKELNQLLITCRQEIDFLLEQAGMLASCLVKEKPQMVLCHADLHAGNLLIGDDDSMYIVDWDSPILAPRERDLMYAGGGQFGKDYSPEQEESMFYTGYGPVVVNQTAMAYYRYERIIEDLAVECEQILDGRGSDADRRQALVFFKTNFQPGGTIEIARWADRNRGMYGGG